MKILIYKFICLINPMVFFPEIYYILFCFQLVNATVIIRHAVMKPFIIMHTPYCKYIVPIFIRKPDRYSCYNKYAFLTFSNTIITFIIFFRAILPSAKNLTFVPVLSESPILSNFLTIFPFSNDIV